MQPVSCFSRLRQSPEEGKMSFVQFKILYGDNFERRKMHRMKKERFQLITYQETIDYQLECMLLPLQFTKDDRERAGKATMCFTSAAKTASFPGTKHNGRNDKIHVSSAGVLTGKTKSSRQPEMMSIPVTSEFSRRWWNTSSLCRLIHDRPLSSNMYSLNWSGSSMHSNW